MNTTNIRAGDIIWSPDFGYALVLNKADRGLRCSRLNRPTNIRVLAPREIQKHWGLRGRQRAAGEPTDPDEAQASTTG